MTGVPHYRHLFTYLGVGVLAGVLLVEHQLLPVGKFRDVLGADSEVDELLDPGGAHVVALATEPDLLRPHSRVRWLPPSRTGCSTLSAFRSRTRPCPRTRSSGR